MKLKAIAAVILSPMLLAAQPAAPAGVQRPAVSAPAKPTPVRQTPARSTSTASAKKPLADIGKLAPVAVIVAVRRGEGYYAAEGGGGFGSYSQKAKSATVIVPTGK